MAEQACGSRALLYPAALTNTMRIPTVIDCQANSDREVMAFLDEHTRELEGRVAALTEERDKLKTALEESASSAQSKRKILEDMLRVSDAKREDTAVQFKVHTPHTHLPWCVATSAGSALGLLYVYCRLRSACW